MGIDAEQESPAQLARQDARRATTWRGDSAIHAKHMVQLADSTGVIKTTDDEGNYIGLTYDAIQVLMVEHVNLRGEIMHLRQWMDANTSLDMVAKTDRETIQAAKALMDVAKQAVTTCWPVIRTLWENVGFTLMTAGILPKPKEK